MMNWVQPKTDWKNGDFFNINPDYQRIKGNIELLVAMSKEIYGDYPTITLKTVTINDYPTASFFNDIVNAINSMLDNCYRPLNTRSMRLYSSNGVGWDADDLNNIESNILNLYIVFKSLYEDRRRLEFVLGGVNSVN